MNRSVVESGPLTGLIHDLHLPADVSAWPPAPAWCVLAALLTVLLCWMLWTLLRRNPRATYRTGSLVDSAQRHLQHCFERWQQDRHDANYLQQANLVLKRFVLSHHSQRSHDTTEFYATRVGIAELPLTWHGSQWVDWLQQSAEVSLSDPARRGLSVDCYRAEKILPSVQVQQLHAELQQWINQFEKRQGA